MTKYKVGDKVKVRSDLIGFESYKMLDDSNYDAVFIPNSKHMGKLTGRTVTIDSIYEGGGYSLVEDDYGCTWTDEMFEDVVVETLPNGVSISRPIRPSTGWTYQYRVYNQFFDLLITAPHAGEDYAINLARNVAKDYYGLEDQYLNDIKCEYVTNFLIESVVNLNMLKG